MIEPLVQKQFVSLLTSTIKSHQYYEEHPEEKAQLIKQVRELFEDWKTAYLRYQTYWNRIRKTQTTDEIIIHEKLQNDAISKHKKFQYLALHSSCLEIRQMHFEALQILNGSSRYDRYKSESE